MADFSTWSHENLARFAAESQAEIVRLNNDHAETLRLLAGLAADYYILCDQFCLKPERHEAYMKAKEIVGA